MSNRGSPEGHMGHICVVMRATHDMPESQSMSSLFRMFFTLGNSLSFQSVKNILNKEEHPVFL
jgi:hypothetical protein